MSTDPSRRHAAKRFNERIRLLATFLNNSAIAIFVGAVVLPFVNEPSGIAATRWIWLAGPVILHMMAQAVLSFIRSED